MWPRSPRFKVEWLSCPPLNKNEPLSFELGAGQSVSVGTVSSNSTWTFDVKPCP